jgi:subtilisin-like proprotein convertase family protein
LDNVSGVSSGDFHIFALQRDGTLLGWGQNSRGEVGNDAFSRGHQALPTPVIGYPNPVVSAYADGPCDPIDIDPLISGTSGGTTSRHLSEVCLNLRDDAYDGTLESMTCLDLDISSMVGVGSDLTVAVGLVHPRVGDLVVKLVAPDGDVYPLMSRPGFNEGTDDGSGAGGNTANITNSYEITFDAAAGTSAEELGQSGGDACPSSCTFAPDADDALPNNTIDAITGENSAGIWRVCVGDAVTGNKGRLISAGVSFTSMPL